MGLALVLVLLGGCGAWLLLGPVAHGGFDPPGLVDHLGGFGDALTAPFARWDSVWYLTIARDGYVNGPDTAFFPLYPLLVALAGGLGPGLVAGGVLVSLISLVVALRLLWLLTDLELGAVYPEVPRLVVLITALGPMAFFFTAVYSESLYLALSVGAFLAARQGRWARAGGLGALAAATRSEGVILMGALALLYFEQAGGAPLRLDNVRRWMAGVGGSRPVRALLDPAWPRPRRHQAFWLGLVPLGLVAYIAWLWQNGLDPMGPFKAQEAWFRHFSGPVDGVGQAVRAAVAGAQQLLSGQSRIVYWPAAGGDPLVAAEHNVGLFVFLLGAVPPLVVALRRLPLAYGAYALVAIAVVVSYPVAPQPLASLPRYLVVLFPLQMAGAIWLAGHPRLRMPLLGVGAAALVGCAGLFATWYWIA